jgi:DNA integrity scanning protein DisA with diadenylate cyclase activity
MNESIHSYLKHFFVFIGFIFVSIAYFSPVINGKKIYQSDIVQYQGMAKQQIDYQKNNGVETYWTNSAFGGMPTYQLGAKYDHNYIKKLDLFLRFLPRPADYLFLYLISFYVLLLTLKIDYKFAILGALAFGFSTYLIIIIGVGHNSKAHAISYMPLVIAGILLVFQKRYFFGFIISTLSIGLQLVANHFQMTYYLLFIVLFLISAYFIKSINEKKIKEFLKSIVILIFSSVMALSMNATNLLATAEYAKQSTRSKSELNYLPDGSKRIKNTGLDRNYITEYSYGILETFNLFIPRFMGGSNSEDIGNNSKTYQAYKSIGANSIQALNESKRAPMYWGDQPIVEAPAYIGAVILFFCFLSLFLYHGFHKWWIWFVIVLAMLLSYGRNLSILTDFFIDYIPLYNKFRAVSSIQVIVEFCIPILAVFGLKEIFDNNYSNKEKLKAVKKTTIFLSSLCLSFIVFKNKLFDFVGLRDEQYLSYYGQEFIKALRADRADLMVDDSLRSMVLVVISGILLFTFIRKNLNKNLTLIFIALLILFDLVGINYRYVNNDDFVSSQKVDFPYQANRIDDLIMNDPEIFRVYDTSDGSTKASYFHNSINGYHAAKMRRFNEVLQFHIDKGNPEVFNMLNTKYIIYRDDNNQLQYILNDQANGNSWFVKNLTAVPDADTEIAALYEIDSKDTAIINSDFLDSKNYKLNSDAKIELVDYSPNKLIYKSYNSEKGFAVFSENFYNNGWEAKIDGIKVPHQNVNYILRGLEIPKGYHEIVFEFKPRVVYLGTKISLFSSILFLVLLSLLLIISRSKK